MITVADPTGALQNRVAFPEVTATYCWVESRTAKPLTAGYGRTPPAGA
jgi:hypothetical protein